MIEDQPNQQQLRVEEDERGLVLTVDTPPGRPEFSDMLVFFFGAGLVLMGFCLMVTGEDGVPVFEAMLILCGLALSAMMYYMRTRKMRGFTNEYCVKVEKGFATFSQNNLNRKTFKVNEIGRMWVTKCTTNGMLTGVEITAYCNGGDYYIFCVTEAAETLGGRSVDSRVAAGNEILDHIVEYLNNHLTDTDPVKVDIAPERPATTNEEKPAELVVTFPEDVDALPLVQPDVVEENTSSAADENCRRVRVSIY